ncbi:sensor histidine kinase [Pseudonocardia sediminis]|uniref:sensor histidine kinase n=1 Tax=Pseudonocardia sediminis TaxID=1397368 RepID=UPI001028885A|nr:sensor histidine kinase [Pseudonocardia sediminis]
MQQPGRRWSRALSRASWLVAAASAVSVVAAVPLAVANWRTVGHESVYVVNAIIGAVVPMAGAFLLSRRPGHRIGIVLLSASGLGISFLALSWATYALQTRPGALPGADWAGLVGGLTWVPFLALVTLLPLWFPDGRLPGPFWRAADGWVLGLLIGVEALSVVEPRVALGLAPNPLFAGPAWVTPAVDTLTAVAVFSGLLLCLPGAVLRHVRAGPVGRVQQRWFLLAVALVTASLFVPGPPISDVVTGVALCLVALAITAAVLRHRLYDIDVVVHRALVYTTLTVTGVLLFLGVVALVGLVLPDGAALVGAAVVAVTFAPLRERLQRMARRLLYGDGDDPYAALTRLATRLERNLEPEDVPAVALAEVIAALRVPHAAVLVSGARLAEAGTVPSDGRGAETIPLAHQGEHVGDLEVTRRGPSEPLTGRDRALLADLARPLGAVLHAAALRTQLRRSREALVVALERERSRLHRDLHDGIGPSLAALVLGLDAIAHAARGDGAALAVPELAGELKSDVRVVIADLRRVVDELRPPALDELGLAGALDRHLATYRSVPGRTRIRLHPPGPLDGLSAAVEVAAYRIVAEAVTNAVRHSGASTCEVRIALEDRLVVEVVDDGRGIPSPEPAGTGLPSLRERASALGGECVVSRRDRGGTRVRAALPVHHG